ncbi:MAG: RNA 2'-phosphotransferase [Actinobacteria bacterium HGW-Actinobacteria-4]|nr:MAG: RNA 2'-phosphotransferase [Actinobacteria bacterium HGW-Actinobacteria-4]
MSHALRHEPWLYELELDQDGWVGLDQLLEALRSLGPKWASVDRAAVAHMIETSAKVRHELDGDRVRALYGHSVPAVIRKQPATPPAELFHGTSPEAWEVIRGAGLVPMGRQYVHMSIDIETALAVGGRKCESPVLLRVNAASAHASGAAFYAGNDMVWLADAVPPEFLEQVQE